MKLYKLTDQNGQTKNSTQWGEGITHTAEAVGTELCTNKVIHAYVDPTLAMLINPVHANFKNPQLWECEGDIVSDDGTKVGCKNLTTVMQLHNCQEVTTTQRVAFGILASMQVYKESQWTRWAMAWLDGSNRHRLAANAAAYVAASAACDAANAAAANAAVHTVNDDAANAANAAANAACDAASAAAYAASSAAYAASSAANAAYDAAYSAYAAASAATNSINLVDLAHKCLEYV